VGGKAQTGDGLGAAECARPKTALDEPQLSIGAASTQHSRRIHAAWALQNPQSRARQSVMIA